MLRIPSSIYERIVEHAKREFPLECCGILGGKEGTVEKDFELSNIEKSSTRYEMAPQEQLRVFQTLEEKSMELIAIYHSHPHTVPFPSEIDVELAFYLEAASIIISLMEKDSPLVKAFRIEKGDILREEIEVI